MALLPFKDCMIREDNPDAPFQALDVIFNKIRACDSSYKLAATIIPLDAVAQKSLEAAAQNYIAAKSCDRAAQSFLRASMPSGYCALHESAENFRDAARDFEDVVKIRVTMALNR